MRRRGEDTIANSILHKRTNDTWTGQRCLSLCRVCCEDPRARRAPPSWLSQSLTHRNTLPRTICGYSRVSLRTVTQVASQKGLKAQCLAAPPAPRAIHNTRGNRALMDGAKLVAR